ncbi:eukaryotic initiation factor 4E [Xylariales sp. PMI_506]|nr:eukaryotic initiation factor 4E [Xylariales sp. PMI_506]
MDNKSSFGSRRSNNLSLATGQTDSSAASRDFSSLTSRSRNGGTSSHGRANPFAATTPGGSLMSPTSAGGSNAFGLGSGAFASFGSAKTPKASGNPFDLAMGSVGSGAKTPSTEKSAKEATKSITGRSTSSASSIGAAPIHPSSTSHPLQESWSFWTRPPISKSNGYIPYEKTLFEMMRVDTVEKFWIAYKHLKPPSKLAPVTDYHFFKQGIRPIWEDEDNKHGGKWVLRLKKGVADRYWEEILMACIGGQLCDDAEQVNGAVLSVRNGEDIISIWTASTGQKVLKIRESMRSLLKCPPSTRFDFKSHDESMTQRATIDEQRRERNNNSNNNNNSNHNHGSDGPGTKRSLRNNENNTSRQSQDTLRS